jgi:hypothetical protein
MPVTSRGQGRGRTADLPIFSFQVHLIGVQLPGTLLAVVTPKRHQKHPKHWSYRTFVGHPPDNGLRLRLRRPWFRRLNGANGEGIFVNG